jgi:hypothetical protein
MKNDQWKMKRIFRSPANVDFLVLTEFGLLAGENRRDETHRLRNGA